MKGFHPRRRSNSSANEELEPAGRKMALSFERQPDQRKRSLSVESRVGKKYVDGLPGANCYDRWKLFIIAGTASSARMALDAHNFLLDGEMDEFGATV